MGPTDAHYKLLRLSTDNKEIYPTENILDIEWKQYQQIEIKPRMLGGA